MKREAGHSLLARLGKTRLRPGGIEATEWLMGHVDFTKDLKILEVACNMGTTMIELAGKYGCHITGLDQSEEALEHARENIKNHHLEDKLSVIQGNALHLPFEDNSFDVVINEAMLTMLPLEAKDQALSEYARVLKPGGVLLTHDVALTTDDLDVQKQVITDISQAIHVPVTPLTASGWKEKIESHGFKTEQKSGPMSLLDPIGLVRDEGVKGALYIMMNGMKKENQEHFLAMFNFFRDNKENVGYVANYSVKEA